MGSSEKVQFANAAGEMLAARLDHPAGDVRAFALFAHCFTCSKDIFAASRISQRLCERGIAVLRFDFTGLGHSEGEFANTNFSSNLDDLERAAAYLRDKHQAPSLLIGHSLGGAAVLAVASRIPEALAVATIGAPFDPDHVRHNFAGAEAEIKASGEAEVQLGGRPFRIRKQFLDDIAGHSLEQAIRELRKALIVFHAPLDAYVGIDNAGAIFSAARHPKSFVSLDDADHLLTKRRDAEYVAEVLAAWAGRYLPELPNRVAEDLPAGVVRVAETGAGRFAQEVRVGAHRLAADEPLAYGGNDTGPGPYDLLAAALGACTSMTVRMYADRKKWPLERVAVDLRHEKIHAEDCADCESTPKKIDRIERRLHIDGPLDSDQRQRLLEIADRCPVHQTLSRENVIVTELDG